MTSDRADEISRSIFREAHDAFFVVRPRDLRILDVNPAALRLTGMRRKQLLERTVQDLLQPGDVTGLRELIDACQSTSHHVGSAEYGLLRDGSRALPIQLSASRIHTEPETLALLVVRDVSKMRMLEDQLSHARRMEAIGRLSTGVAHELNNVLMVITGYAELLRDGCSADDAAQAAEQIRSAGRRAASFTRQLLEFGSRRPADSRPLDLCEIVDGMQKMLAPLLGELVEVETRRARGRVWIEAEQPRIEQLLVNLAVNARDAMPDGGTLTIETAPVDVSPEEAATRPGSRAGAHVMLRVTDTGIGMDDATVARAFEPFFTTKASAQGTGLGLAMVYGTVQQCGGHVAIDSEVGRGTTFTILFPAVSEPAPPAPRDDERPSPPPRGGARVLVVEDNDGVRQLVERVLQRAGYSVTSVSSGAAALEVCERDGDDLDLVLSDYLMPGMRGDELCEQLARRRPAMRVLLMSGCASPDGVDEDPSVLGACLLKPFTPAELLARVRQELER